jgi:hypothetical protein
MTDEERQKDAWQEALEFYAAQLEKRIVELEMKYGAPAGMLEAACIAEEWDSGWGEDRNTRVARQTAVEIAAAIRARAAEFNPNRRGTNDTDVA